MDGKEVFKVAIPSLVQGVEESLKIAGININEVNWYVPHQANLRIIDSVAKKLEIDMDKVVVTVDHPLPFLWHWQNLLPPANSKKAT